MKKLRNLAALSAFLLLSGCSTGNAPADSDKPETTKATEALSEVPENFDPNCKMDYFGFTVEEPFKIKDTSKIDDHISMYFLELSGSTAQFSLYEQDSYLSPLAYMEDLEEMYSVENGFLEPAWEFLKEGGLTKAVFSCKTETDVDVISGLRKYCVISNGKVLLLDEAYELKDEEKVIAASEKFLDTVGYISDDKLATTQWTEINDCFSITVDPKWYMEYNQCNGDCRYYSLKYSQAESKQLTKVWVDFQADTSKSFATAAEFMNDLFSEDKDGKTISRSVTNFQEYAPVELAEFTDSSGFTTKILAFVKDEVVYSIGYCYPAGNEQVEADIKSLIDTFEVGSWQG